MVECFFIFSMDFLFWNIRGLGKGEKVATINKLIKQNNISFLGLVEMKHRKTLKCRMRRIWGNDDFDV